MYIFYDFETSSRDTIGQILSYAFILCSSQFQPLKECCGLIKPNPTQLIEAGAILTNKLSIDLLQEYGTTEYEAAQKMVTFISDCLKTHGSLTLVGFNSNSFDLGFLRTTLIRNGFNPYFEGKLKNIDMLHVAQWLAFQHPHDFPWVRTSSSSHTYFSFKLEDLATEFNLIQEAQSHDAREDVLLTMSLAHIFQKHYAFDIDTFVPFEDHACKSHRLVKQKTRHFADIDDTPKPYIYHYYWILSVEKKSVLAIDLLAFQNRHTETDTLSESDLLSTIRYLNANKAFFHAEPVTEEEQHTWNPSLLNIQDNAFFQRLSQSQSLYFELTEKNWDIEYQIHALGFERIDTLGQLVRALLANPAGYEPILKSLLESRKTQKDTFLIQLYNRFYLNNHPHPRPDYFKKYVTQRYLTGSMLRDPQSLKTPQDYLQEIETLLNSDTLSDYDVPILKSLATYTQHWINTYAPPIPV